MRTSKKLRQSGPLLFWAKIKIKMNKNINCWKQEPTKQLNITFEPAKTLIITMIRGINLCVKVTINFVRYRRDFSL